MMKANLIKNIFIFKTEAKNKFETKIKVFCTVLAKVRIFLLLACDFFMSKND